MLFSACHSKPVEAIPGLYSPRDFLTALRVGHYLATEASRLDGATRTQFLREHHLNAVNITTMAMAKRFPMLNQMIHSDRIATLLGVPSLARGETPHNLRTIVFVPREGISAEEAALRARAKAAAETPYIAALRSTNVPARATSMASRIWRADVSDAVSPTKISQPSLQLIARETPGKIEPLVKRVQILVATDSWRNQHLLKPTIASWLAEGSYSLENLNRRVYNEVFLTPQRDPWLGLHHSNVYNGLPGAGIVAPRRKASQHKAQQGNGAR